MRGDEVKHQVALLFRKTLDVLVTFGQEQRS
jgi:hypothetical protein